VVHVSGFPYEWTTTRVLEVFAGTWGPLNVQWIVRLSLSLYLSLFRSIHIHLLPLHVICQCLCLCVSVFASACA
jgi:hypothetical protein